MLVWWRKHRMDKEIHKNRKGSWTSCTDSIGDAIRWEEQHQRENKEKHQNH